MMPVSAMLGEAGIVTGGKIDLLMPVMEAENLFRHLVLPTATRDQYTVTHCKRVAHYAAALARRLDLPKDRVQTVALGAYFHDLGKFAVPNEVLLKPGPLTSDERAIIEQHPVIGADFLLPLTTLREAAAVPRHHHEKYDGSGYPDGLAGDAIPLSAQIVGVVDVYDALTTTRPYRTALSHQDAAQILLDEVARGWRQRELVEAFLGLLDGAP